MQAPAVSVAVPTHARPHYLDAALESVARQTAQPAEVIVSEDGDDAETARVVAAYAGSGLPIRHHRNVPPLKQAGNRRRAFELTTGEFVAMLDDDDVWESEFLEKTTRELAAHPECGFVAADHYLIDEGGEILEQESDASSTRFGRSQMQTGVYDDVLERHLLTRTFSLHTSLFRRSLLAEFGFFPEYSGTAPDFALFLELGARHVRAHYVAERLGRYRVHPGQAVGNRVAMGEGIVETLAGLARRHSLAYERRRAVARAFRASVVELAIARAHACDRRGVLRTLRRYGELGWGPTSIDRFAVLAALFLGVRPRDA